MMRGAEPAGIRGAARLAQRNWTPPPHGTMHLGQAFREAGCAVHFSCDSEADVDMARLANALGANIMAHDSDLLILEAGSARYLDWNTLDLRSNTVTAYPPGAVQRALGLTREQLMTLVCVLGSDVFRRREDTIERCTLAHEGLDVVEAVAACVRSGDVQVSAEAQEAVSRWYTPPAADPALEAMRNVGMQLLTRDETGAARYLGPLCIEDTDLPCSVHAALQPLRHAVYRREGVTRVREVLTRCGTALPAQDARLRLSVSVHRTAPAAPTRLWSIG